MKSFNLNVKTKCKGYPKGGFSVQCFGIDNGKNVSKSFNIGRRSAEECYLLAVEAGEQLAKQYNVGFNEPISFEEAIKIIDGTTEAKPKSKKKQIECENTLLEKFGNLLRFKSMIRSAYKQQGYERVKHVLNESLALLEEVSKADREELQRQNKANEMVAQSLVDISIETGIDMADKCATDAIRAIYLIKLKQRNQEQAEKEKVSNIYELNGEKWNGQGQPPATFKAWLREDENREIDDLLVG